MTPELMALVRQAVVLAAWLMTPVLVAGLVAGAIAGATGWREATLSHVIRVLFVALAWGLSFPWIADSITAFTRVTWGGG